MKVVGYMEGTDPGVLTKLVVEGVETLPLSFLRLEDETIFNAMLATVKAYDIMVLFVVPKELHEKATKAVLSDDLKYKFVDPADLADSIMAHLKG